MATLTATGQSKVQQGFAPLMPGFHYATFNDWASVESALTKHTAAIMIEPIQGEGGVQVADHDFLHQLRQLCTEREILLIFDEIQTGMGRTGTLFAYEHCGIKPDIMTLAKGLGGGLPIGACLATDEIAQAFEPGSHASTFGGNPLACSAAIAVLEVLLDGELEKSRLIGAYLQKGLLELQSRNSLILEVRGRGLLQGLELSIEGKPIVQDCQARRVLINCTMNRVLRFVPPLIITQAEIDLLLTVLSDVLNKRL
jgi:acetylornithine aminotransferase